MNTYLNVLTAEAESAHRTQQLERELEWARRRRSAEAAGGAAAPRATRRLPKHWLRRLVAALG